MAASDNNQPTSQDRAPAHAFSASSAAAKPRGKWKVYLLTFAVTVLVVWGVGTYAYIFFSPRLIYYTLEQVIVSNGLGGSGAPDIPINTLYTMPTLASPSKSNTLESTGNHDTLYTVGWLDLSARPEVLHVPDMAGRYYAVQLTDPWGTVFAYVGRRTTGSQAGDYVISGPGWKGTVPNGMSQIVAPNNTVLLIGRTLVESNSDLAAAYGLAKHIQLTTLSQRQPSQ
jgi:hypothetical protein